MKVDILAFFEWNLGVLLGDWNKFHLIISLLSHINLPDYVITCPDTFLSYPVEIIGKNCMDPKIF